MSSRRLLASLCVLFGPGLVLCFNLAPEFARVITDPSGQSSSYFGYTVALRNRKGSEEGWLLVGAPKGNSTHESHGHLAEPGLVYQCNLQEDSCQPLLLDNTGNKRYPAANGDSYTHKKDYAWIGAAIDVLDGDNGQIVVCGPRWKNQFHSQYYLMNGICYWLKDSAPEDANAESLAPLINANHQGYTLEAGNSYSQKAEEVFYYAYGEAGLSVHFAQNGTELLIGAPGVFEWKGTIIKYSNDAFLGGGISRRSTEIMYTNVIIPNPVKTQKLARTGYFGYSVSSGKFSNYDNRTLYVGGAPRAAMYRGKVFVFDFPQRTEDEYDIVSEMEGTQMGEYFGATVCAIDVNGDGLDDLVVGAPQHSLSADNSRPDAGDEGRVYVFINGDRGRMVEVTDTMKLMGSREPGARFGSSIASLGDVDQDGFLDFAVGAPYEDGGRGAVYIYLGKQQSSKYSYSQRITALQIDESIRGFGISISRGVDIDGNRYNDMAVGAYDSGHAVVIKSRPVIMFHPSLSSDVSKISFNATGFHVDACLFYTGKFAPRFRTIRLILNLDQTHDRAVFKISGNNTFEFTEMYQVAVPMCKTLKIEITKAETQQDFSKPIDIIMSAELVENNPERRKRQIDQSKYFCSTCPVLNPSEPTTVTLRVPYTTGCGDYTCKTDLRVSAELLGLTPPLVVGSTRTLKMRVAVLNRGEPAFLTRVSVTLPRVSTLVRRPQTCQELESSENDIHLLCDLGNPLKQNVKGELLLELDLKAVTSGLAELVYNVSAVSSGEEQNPADNIFLLQLPLQTITDVTIAGNSAQDQIVYLDKNETTVSDQLFGHTYEVRNFGPSPVSTVQAEFHIPVGLSTADGVVKFINVYEPKAYLDAQPFLCKSLGMNFDMEAVEGGSVALDEEGVEVTATLKKRSVEPMIELPVNRTLFVNCSQAETTCVTVQCDVGPFISGHTRAVIHFPMKALLKRIDAMLETRDIVLVSTYGSVRVVDPTSSVHSESKRPEEAVVSTMFLGKVPEKGVETWIIVLSICVGILILLLIILALVKMGFFKRIKKDELDAMKQSALIDNEFVDTPDDSH